MPGSTVAATFERKGTMSDTDPQCNDQILALSRWIDASPTLRATDPHARMWSRVAKVGAECGEVFDALGGMTGENPRKGVTHTQAHLEYELLDVALAALGAVHHLRGNTASFDVMERFRYHVEHVADRAAGKR